MTPEDLSRWREELKLTHRGAAEALGMSLTSYQQLERGENWKTGKPVTIDQRTALACAALRAGLAPEGVISAARATTPGTTPPSTEPPPAHSALPADASAGTRPGW